MAVAMPAPPASAGPRARPGDSPKAGVSFTVTFPEMLTVAVTLTEKRDGEGGGARDLTCAGQSS